jgi:hypothetical protein
MLSMMTLVPIFNPCTSTLVCEPSEEIREEIINYGNNKTAEIIK